MKTTLSAFVGRLTTSHSRHLRLPGFGLSADITLMKVLIQDVKSGEYLAQHGTRTTIASHAQNFRYTSYAYSVLRREKISGLRVVFYFEDFDYSINARRWPGGRLCQRLNTAVYSF